MHKCYHKSLTVQSVNALINPDLAIVLWHMVQTCLPVSDATVIRQASSGESNLFVKGDFGVSGRSFLRFFKKKGMPYIIVTSQRGSLAVMNRTIFELKQTNIVKEGFFKPKEALPAPGNPSQEHTSP